MYRNTKSSEEPLVSFIWMFEAWGIQHGMEDVHIQQALSRPVAVLLSCPAAAVEWHAQLKSTLLLPAHEDRSIYKVIRFTIPRFRESFPCNGHSFQPRASVSGRFWRLTLLASDGRQVTGC